MRGKTQEKLGLALLPQCYNLSSAGILKTLKSLWDSVALNKKNRTARNEMKKVKFSLFVNDERKLS